MDKHSKDIKTLTDAINHLEKAGSNKVHDLHEAFGKNFDEVKKAFENLKPYMEDIKDKVETETKHAKHEAEHKIKENPWLALGIASLFGIFIGWLLGRDRK